MRQPSLSRGKEIALELDTNECLARALTKPQRTLLRAAKKNGYVNAIMQRRRMCERLAAIGLLSKSGLVAYAISEATDAGASLEMVRHAATHSDVATTARYSRNAPEKIEQVQRLRLAHRDVA